MMIPVVLMLMSFFLSPSPVAAQQSDAPRLSDQCLLKPEYGHCKAHMEVHFFNTRTGRCEVSYGCPEFTPFQTKQECVAACEQGFTITQNEYAVLEALLKEYDSSPWWHIGGKTEAGQLDERTVAFLNAPDMDGKPGMSLEMSMIRDFNDKNRRSYALSGEFTAGKNPVVFRSSKGIRTITVSRVGFNEEQTRALVFLSDDFRNAPEVLIQEGFFILLERDKDTWKISKQVKTRFKHS